MKSHCQTQTLSPTRPFAISGIIIVIISGSGRVGLGWSAYMVYRYPMHHSLRFDAFLTDLRHIERILTMHHLTVSFSVLIIIISD